MFHPLIKLETVFFSSWFYKNNYLFQESGEKRRLEKKLADTNEKLTKEEYLAKQAELERVSCFLILFNFHIMQPLSNNCSI